MFSPTPEWTKSYQIKIHGTVVATQEMRIGELMVITGDNRRPDVPGDDAREPAFGMKAMWISDAFATEVKREGFSPVDNLSVVLTHVSEVIRNNLSQLLSYKDVRALIDRLDPGTDWWRISARESDPAIPACAVLPVLPSVSRSATCI
jgi:flagellar biosynthesis protein FlhA